MSDKREFPRKPIQTNALLKYEGQEIPAIVQDITVKGIQVKTDRPFDPGASLELNLTKQEELNSTVLSGVVTRCGPVEHNKFILAISLLNPDDNYMMDALAFIHRNQA
jgi:hypothetical protein